MAINLTQVQSDLQTMPLPDLMKYANGSNPLTVPPWMALTEMNARKQAQATQQAMANTPSGTVASKLENEVDPTQAQGVKSLTTPKAGVNMTKAKAGTDMTQNQAIPTLAQLDPTLAAPPAPPPPAPAAPPPAPVEASVTEAANQPQQVVNASHGGLADIPLKMFKQRNFAPGGIVAFGDTGPDTVGETAKKQTGVTPPASKETEAEARQKSADEQLRSDRESAFDIKDKLIAAGKDVLSAPMRAGAGLINFLGIRPARAITGANIPYIFGSDPNYTESPTPYSDELLKKNTPPVATPVATPKTTAVTPKTESSTGVVTPPVAKKSTAPSSAPAVTPATPVKSIDERMKEAREGIAALFPNSANPQYKVYTPEEEMENFKTGLTMNEQKNALAGISKDPYTDYKARLERLDAEHAKARENEGFERFRAFASGMVHADPTKGLGASMAGGADSVSALKLQQAALHDAHEKAALESMKAMAEAKDARARGDKTEADKRQSDKVAADKAKIDLALKLKEVNIHLVDASNHAVATAISGFNAENQAISNASTAEYQKVMAKAALIQANKPSDFAQKAELFKNNRALFDRIYPESVKLIDEAYKTWLEASKWDPSIGTWQEWSTKKGIPTGQPSISTLPPKFVKDGVTYILQPNGNYTKQ